MYLGNLIKRFCRDEAGTVTVEMVLWLPLFLGCFILVVDLSILLHRVSMALLAIEDGNRRLAVRDYTTNKEVIDYVFSEIDDFAPGATVTSVSSMSRVTTNAEMPASEMTATRWFAVLGDINLNISSTQILE